MDDDDTLRDLSARVFLGAEAERFLQSSVGRYMVQRAEAQREQAIADFARAAPTDAAAIMAAQMKLRMADGFQQWIADLLQDGQEAERQVDFLTSTND